MRKYLPIVVFMIASCLFGFGQVPENIKCPSISVYGPSGIVEPGQTADFKINIVGVGETSDLEYLWAVEPKLSFVGQGTSTIKVEYPTHQIITATVTVKGLGASCPNVASETYVISPPIPPNRKLGEIFDTNFTAHRGLFITIESTLREQPDAVLFVVLQFRRGTTTEAIELNRTRLEAQLRKSKIDPERTRFVVADNGHREILFWLVSPGAEPPSIEK